MSDSYIEKNVNQIMKEKEDQFPLNMAMASAWIMGNLKGINLKVLDVTESSPLVDYFVLASANNPTQAQSMADEIVRQMKRLGYKSLSKEGSNPDSDWILIDVGDIIIHIFLDISRDVYDLDRLWEEAVMVEIPQDYYFSEGVEETAGEGEEEKDYF